MKNKVLFAIHYLWASLVAFTMPLCIGWIFMNITGNGKGFDYDLGSEKRFYQGIGCIELLFWLMFAIIPVIALFVKLKRKGKIYVILSAALFVALFTAFVYCVIGGWQEFLRCFHP